MQASANPTGLGFKQIWQIIRLLMGVVGLVLLFQVVDIQEVKTAITEADPLYILLAWVLSLFSTAFKTERWRALLLKNDLQTPFRYLFGTYLIGTFYSQFLPGSSAGGDAMRMAESSVDTGRAADSVAAVIVERGIGLTTIVTTASLILLINQPEGIPTPVTLTINVLSVLGVSGLLILRFGWFLGLITRALGKIGLGKVAQKVTHLSESLQGDLGSPRLVVWMVILSLLANACSMTAAYLGLLAIKESVPYLSFISLVALIVTLEAIPLTPGSLGVREGAYVFFLGYLGIPRAAALTASLLMRLVGWTQALMGGGVLLQRALFASKTSISAHPEVGAGD